MAAITEMRADTLRGNIGSLEAANGAAGRNEIALTKASPKALIGLSQTYGWSLIEAEMAAASHHFKSLKREPTRAEMETIAQTWSEHCKHKTFTNPIRYRDGKKTRVIRNLLKDTIMDATLRLKKPWCLSVFKDNAGIVRLNDKWAVAFKVETHNHPCAVEPYGGASTGVGGVIRDILGAGLGAKPILNTDIFCLCRPDYDAELLPDNVLHPRRTFASVVAGVRDYGNRMGIPTAGGAIWFDEEFRFNPLVFCGTVGLIPVDSIRKEVQPGDLIVVAGGRTGRDGLHGATFSSAALEGSSDSSAGREYAPGTARKEYDLSRGAVQVGHAIVEKQLLDALMPARDRKLYRSITDCGAGGFSSAIGELGAHCGAVVRLENAPLKTADLEPWEIWLSESQERMVLSVPPKNLKALQAVFASEGVESAVLGEFTKTKRLEVYHKDQRIVDLSMDFLHEGNPKREQIAVWDPPKAANGRKLNPSANSKESICQAWRALLGHWNVCSRAWVIRQYDHEVQGGAIIKPLQGQEHDGPGDACVIWPHAATRNTEDFTGVAVAQGLNPSYGKMDPYAMAVACADEALRNLVCVGADISRAAFLDNFCWGNPEDPQVLGGMVRAALGCREAALGFEVPFISGKDSLYNEYADTRGNGSKGARHAIPGTLLISAIAPVADIRKTVTMDFKATGNAIYLVGRTSNELAGSLYAEWAKHEGGVVPTVDLRSARDTMRSLSKAISMGLVTSCHDLSEGGLAVALAEMAFAGEVGAKIDLDCVLRARDVESEAIILFSESTSRFLVEVVPEKEKAFLKAMKGAPLARIGDTIANPVIRLIGLDGSAWIEESLAGLKSSWLDTIPKAMGAQ